MNGISIMVAKKKTRSKVVRRKAEKTPIMTMPIPQGYAVDAKALAPIAPAKKTGKKKVTRRKPAALSRVMADIAPTPPEPTRMSEIAALVSMCGQSGVTSLKMGDIEINFMGRPAIADLPKTPVIVGEQASPGLQSDPLKLTDDDRELFRKSNLLVNDPEEYEREIIESFTNPPEMTRHARSEPIGH